MTSEEQALYDYREAQKKRDEAETLLIEAEDRLRQAQLVLKVAHDNLVRARKE